MEELRISLSAKTIVEFLSEHKDFIVEVSRLSQSVIKLNEARFIGKTDLSSEIREVSECVHSIKIKVDAKGITSGYLLKPITYIISKSAVLCQLQ